MLPTSQMAISQFPIINISNFISKHGLTQFWDNGYKNFDNMVDPDSKVIYITSDANELLELKKNDLKFIKKIPMKLTCAETLNCDEIKIDIVLLHANLLCICFVYRSIHSNNNSFQSSCRLFDREEFNIQGNWIADTYIPQDFEHRSVQLYLNDILYSGFVLSNNLHIYKNPTIFGNSKDFKKLKLPRYFLKESGDFVTSFQYNESIYFLFVETDILCGYREEKRVTRLLKLCDNDYGDSNDEFRVFGKIDIECIQSNENKAIPSFKYIFATNGQWLPQSSQLVITFSNNYEERESSAICYYSIQMIENAFKSELKKSSEIPSFQTNTDPNICRDLNKNLNSLNSLYKNYPLRKEVLKNEAVFHLKQTRFIKITSDESNYSKNKQIVSFVSAQYNDRNSIFQFILQPTFCVLKKFLTSENITMLKFTKEDNKAVLYIGTSERLIKMPMDLCKDFKTENLCLLTNAPYCYWDSVNLKCRYISKENELSQIPNKSYTCPRILNENQQNNKLWTSCKLMSLTDDMKQIGLCDCIRQIGIHSKESEISVSDNCKIDGNWTQFSAWSDCSVTCGVGIQTRVRTCDNPRSQRKGSLCKGSDTDIRICDTKIVCEDKSKRNYSDWLEWSSCSKSCGFSFRIRTRQCLRELCTIIPIERKLCRTNPCEYKIFSEWTRWSPLNKSTSTKTRARFQCLRKYQHESLNMSFSSIMQHNISTSCSSENCFINYNTKYDKWSNWSECKNKCEGIERKTRFRKCNGNWCFGPTIDYQECSMNSCDSFWNCWSSWKGCLTTCETSGTRTRTRQCINGGTNKSCNGNHIETTVCPIKPCLSYYSHWSTWSSCQDDGFITRTRKCLSKSHCLFPLIQTKNCAQPLKDKSEEYSYMYMIISGLVGFVLGILIGAIVCYIWWRCTINVINSSSLKISNIGIPTEIQSQYDSQSLQTIPEQYTFFRQRTMSNNENYPKPPSPRFYYEPPSSSIPLYSNFQIRHPTLPEEYSDTKV